MEITKDQLQDLYVLQNQSSVKIAALFGCSSRTIINKLRKYGIKIKDRYECQYSFTLSKEILIEEYIDNDLSCISIANKYGSSDEVIRRLLIKYNIERKSNTRNFGGWNKGLPHSEEFKQNLSKIRIDKFQSGEITHWNTGNHWTDDVRLKISSTLLNGRDPAPSRYGPDWRFQRTSCLQRDNFTCQQCGSISNLEVHHWDPYRFSYDNSLDNLITLCSYCHRSKHEEYKQEGLIQEMDTDFMKQLVAERVAYLMNWYGERLDQSIDKRFNEEFNKAVDERIQKIKEAL